MLGCAPQIVASLGLVLVSFLLVWGSVGLVRFEFEILGPIRFSGKLVSTFLLCFILGVVGLD